MNDIETVPCMECNEDTDSPVNWKPILDENKEPTNPILCEKCEIKIYGEGSY